MGNGKITYFFESSKEAEAEFFKAMPKKLYKYRTWHNEHHQALLKQSEIFFPSPNKFNDPYDCGLPFKQDPSDFEVENIKRKLEETAPKRFSALVRVRSKVKNKNAPVRVSTHRNYQSK
jgi:hypothetical protein